MVIWLTGSSGAGKTTIANNIGSFSSLSKKDIIILDGDEIRQGLNKDLGFSTDDRTENIRRIAELAKFLHDKHFAVIVAVISPKKFQRELAKNIIGKDNFLEVYCDTSLGICKKRDVKGLYAKSMAGNVKNFGYPNEYEQSPPWEIFYLPTGDCKISSCIEILIDEIKRKFINI